MSDRFRYNYSANEPGDGCATTVAATIVVVLIILACWIFGPLLWKIEPVPAPNECPTHSCMYNKS